MNTDTFIVVFFLLFIFVGLMCMCDNLIYLSLLMAKSVLSAD